MRTTRDSSGMRSSLMRPPSEDRQLRRRSGTLVDGTDRPELDGIPATVGDADRPGLELLARPLESVVVVAHRPGGQPRIQGVVLAVRRRDDHRARLRVREDGVLERGEPGLVDVLDDLHEHHRVVAAEPIVAVHRRTVQERDPVALGIGGPREPEPRGGALEGLRRDVDADDLGEAPGSPGVRRRSAPAPAPMSITRRAADVGERREDGLGALDAQRGLGGGLVRLIAGTAVGLAEFGRLRARRARPDARGSGA